MSTRILSTLSIVGVISITVVAYARACGFEADSGLSFTGTVEFCIGHDFTGPGSNTMPGFLYNHTHLDEVSLNLAFAKARYSSGTVRANVALMSGTYAQADLAAEPRE